MTKARAVVWLYAATAVAALGTIAAGLVVSADGSTREGIFILPALRRLSDRYAALAELAADEAAERHATDPHALGSALLAFHAHPDPSVVGIAPERVDRILGDGARWDLPGLGLAVAAMTLLVSWAVTLRLSHVTRASLPRRAARRSSRCHPPLEVAGSVQDAEEQYTTHRSRNCSATKEPNMASILSALPLLACPVGMGAMMWMMRGKKQPTPSAPTPGRSVELLREERRRLDARIEDLETANPAASPR